MYCICTTCCGTTTVIACTLRGHFDPHPNPPSALHSSHTEQPGGRRGHPSDTDSPSAGTTGLTGASGLTGVLPLSLLRLQPLESLVSRLSDMSLLLQVRQVYKGSLDRKIPSNWEVCPPFMSES